MQSNARLTGAAQACTSLPLRRHAAFRQGFPLQVQKNTLNPVCINAAKILLLVIPRRFGQHHTFDHGFQYEATLAGRRRAELFCDQCWSYCFLYAH